MWVYALVSLSFSPKPLWKFYNDNFCEHFAFYSCSNWHLFLHFCEASLAATDEKVNCVRSCQPKLAAAAFVFVHPKLRPLGAGPGHSPEMMPASETRDLEPWVRGSGLGPSIRAHGEMMRWGGGGQRNTEYSLQSSAHSMYSLLSPSAQVSPKPRTRFRPRASLRVTENNAKFRVLNLANVHRKLLSI